MDVGGAPQSYVHCERAFRCLPAHGSQFLMQECYDQPESFFFSFFFLATQTLSHVTSVKGSG